MVQVKVFDEDHEDDLEDIVNEFLSTLPEDHLIDIKYQISVCDSVHDQDETMFSFSAMVIYKK